VFPEDYELISFFEVEPELLDSNPQIPWFYNTLTFAKEYHDEVLYCTFSPSYGELDLTLVRDQKPIVTLSLHNIQKVEILKQEHSEHLRLTFSADTCMNEFLLTLKPQVSIIWGTT